MKAYLRKLPGGQLIADDDEATEALRRIKAGKVVRAEVVEVRNYRFLKKFMALIGIAFDMWSETVEPMEYKGIPVLPNKDKFRKDITVLAGYFDPVANFRGEVRLEAKSISFAKMEEDEFEKLYSAAIDVILKKVLHGRGLTDAEMRRRVDLVMGFA